jgi:hypothetical protein
MPTTAAQTVLFLSSFSPLFFMFGLLDTFKADVADWICIGLAVLSLLGLGVFLRVVANVDVQSVNVGKAKPRDADAIGYVVVYLVPFLALATDSWQARASLVLFVAVVGALYVRSHIFYVNPVMSLVGYRLFEIEAGNGFVILITRRSFVEPGVSVQARRLSDYVYIE